MGCSPRFNSPWHPSSTGLAERAVGNVKTIVSKLAMDHPKQWHTYLPMAMWCLREIPNGLAIGLAPWILVMGHSPTCSLSILKDSWWGDENLPVNFGDNRSRNATVRVIADGQTDRRKPILQPVPCYML